MAKVKIQGNASGTGVFTITPPATSTDRTLTLPDSAGTLVNTAPSTSGNVLTSDGTNWTSATPAGGKVLKVVSTTKTNAYSVSIGIGAQSGDVTGLTAVITPSAISSKVLVTLTIVTDADHLNSSALITLFRGGSVTSFIGDTADTGSRQRVSGSASAGPSYNELNTTTITFLDEPATTSATTYSVRLSHNDGSTRVIYINRTYGNNDAYYDGRAASSITLMEIGA